MIYSYKELHNIPELLSANEADQILKNILESKNFNSSEIMEKWNEFIDLSVKYSTFRGQWLLLSRDEKNTLDSERTTLHNKIIFTFNWIINLIAEKGNDTSWYTFKEDRQKIGDFACYVSYLIALNGR